MYPKYFGEKDLITSRIWLADVANTFCTSSCPKGANVRLASCLVKDRARDSWEEVGRSLIDEAVDSITWDDFVNRF